MAIMAAMRLSQHCHGLREQLWGVAQACSPCCLQNLPKPSSKASFMARKQDRSGPICNFKRTNNFIQIYLHRAAVKQNKLSGNSSQHQKEKTAGSVQSIGHVVFHKGFEYLPFGHAMSSPYISMAFLCQNMGQTHSRGTPLLLLRTIHNTFINIA